MIKTKYHSAVRVDSLRPFPFDSAGRERSLALIRCYALRYAASVKKLRSGFGEKRPILLSQH